MKRVVFKFIFWWGLLIGFLGLFLASYTFYLVAELSKRGSFTLNSFDYSNDFREESLIMDVGSFFSKNDLEFIYPLFKKNAEFSEWFKTQVKDGVLTDVGAKDLGDIYQVNGIINLEYKRINDCDFSYCFQRKMNFADLPSVLWRGLIGVEDSRFLEHSGVDPKAILRAFYTDIKALGYVEGGSTLTQQLVKNLYFSDEKSIVRKLKEMLVAFYIESKYEKEEILQAYFNEIVWGALSGIRIKGVYAASIAYFGKRPEQLTNYESSILIAMLKAPYSYHPLNKFDKLKERANYLYTKLVESKFVSSVDNSSWPDDQWDRWKKEIEGKDKSMRMRAMALALKEQSPFYQSYVANIVGDEALARIKKMKGIEDKDIAIKMISRDIYHCNDINDCDDFIYYSKFERDLYTAIYEEKHQMGSVIKPIIYEKIFSTDAKPDDVVSLEPIELKLRSGTWSPREPKIETLEVTLREALMKSKNTPVIRKSMEIGFEEMEKFLEGYFPTIQKPLSEFPAQLLGSIELPIANVIRIFHKFFENECKSELSNEEKPLFILSDPTQTTIRNVVSPYLKVFRFFGKTGTTNSSFDNWFIGFDGQTITAVWLGLEGIREQGHKLNLSGATAAYKLFESFRMRSGKPWNTLDCDEFNNSRELEEN